MLTSSEIACLTNYRILHVLEYTSKVGIRYVVCFSHQNTQGILGNSAGAFMGKDVLDVGAGMLKLDLWFYLSVFSRFWHSLLLQCTSWCENSLRV